MSGSRSERQAVLLALLARIKQAAPRERPALLENYQVIDAGSEPAKHTKRRKDEEVTT